jgi:hypothetical protein
MNTRFQNASARKINNFQLRTFLYFIYVLCNADCGPWEESKPVTLMLHVMLNGNTFVATKMSRHNGINCIKEVNTKVSEYFPLVLSQLYETYPINRSINVYLNVTHSNIWIWKHLSDTFLLHNGWKYGNASSQILCCFVIGRGIRRLKTGEERKVNVIHQRQIHVEDFIFYISWNIIIWDKL